MFHPERENLLKQKIHFKIFQKTMIGIILASGRGSRMRNLTSKKPKTLLRYKNKIILEKIIENFESNNIKISI